MEPKRTMGRLRQRPTAVPASYHGERRNPVSRPHATSQSCCFPDALLCLTLNYISASVLTVLVTTHQSFVISIIVNFHYSKFYIIKIPLFLKRSRLKGVLVTVELMNV